MHKISGCLMAGAAKAEITDRGHGFLVHDPLYTKVLILDDGQTKAACITMDILALRNGDVPYDTGAQFMYELRRRIKKEFKIPCSNVIVSATHNHSIGQPSCRQLIEKTLQAFGNAVRNMAPAKAGSGIGHEDRIIMNRILRLRNGQHWTVRHAYPCPPDDDVCAVGPIDSDIGIIKIERIDGKPLSVLYNYACHPIGGLEGRCVSANIPGFASKTIEEQLGHGAVAMFIQGACGDVCDIFYKDVNLPRNTEKLGMMLGLSTLKAVRAIETREDITLNVISRNIALPLKTDIPDIVESLKKEQAELLKSLRFTSLNIKTFLQQYIKYAINPEYPSDYSYRYLQGEAMGDDELIELDVKNRKNIEKYLHNIYAMEKLAKIQDDILVLEERQDAVLALGGGSLHSDLHGMRIGDCVLISSPIEMCTEVSLNIKKASSYDKTFIACDSNGSMRYAPPETYFRKGSYESIGGFLGPGWQKIFEEQADEIIRFL